jgi:hypothetical protein
MTPDVEKRRVNHGGKVGCEAVVFRIRLFGAQKKVLGDGEEVQEDGCGEMMITVGLDTQPEMP